MVRGWFAGGWLPLPPGNRANIGLVVRSCSRKVRVAGEKGVKMGESV
ncbi:MAG: hypothetical protein ACTSUE_25320 [Promethearchaeota archaeon]